jgi:hypothetical protein
MNLDAQPHQATEARGSDDHHGDEAKMGLRGAQVALCHLCSFLKLHSHACSPTCPKEG